MAPLQRRRSVHGRARMIKFLIAASALLAVVLVGSVRAMIVWRRHETIVAGANVYEASKWAYISTLGLLTALFFLRVIQSYSHLLLLFAITFIAWRATATRAHRARDRAALRRSGGTSGGP